MFRRNPTVLKVNAIIPNWKQFLISFAIFGFTTTWFLGLKLDRSVEVDLNQVSLVYINLFQVNLIQICFVRASLVRIMLWQFNPSQFGLNQFDAADLI